jgi:hypothetical protein
MIMVAIFSFSGSGLYGRVASTFLPGPATPVAEIEGAPPTRESPLCGWMILATVPGSLLVFRAGQQP